MSKGCYDWNVAVITGGGGGLGKALAKSLIKKGKKVILMGRTEANLIETAKEIGAVDHHVLDVSQLDTISSSVERLFDKHPEIDCLINNAGVQKPLNFAEPDSVKDSDVLSEINTNITGLVSLTTAFLKHFTKPTCVQNVSSGLAFVPIQGCPVYCATKAFVHSFTLTLRHQLRKSNIIEIIPPLVESNLHRDHSNADDFTKEKMPYALTQDEFIADIEAGWDKGLDEVAAGTAAGRAETWRKAFGATFNQMNPQ
ncbi:hypothetical protein PROFUN_01048 [Planoprotostelium fungivorum]|uniref:Ketoreductase domain-containing protein n=1 Tax=Planoprotostelium fungivorum TaxID=1890364 RepID=A0A2P6N4J4_9EUKA|nr:hypothetical protein PROFUN_01048 [Planoprotostelium fungivorum]